MPNVSFRPNTRGEFFLVVPKAVSNKATVRNLLKRRARHILRLHKNETKINGGTFFFKKGAETLKFRELEDEMLKILK